MNEVSKVNRFLAYLIDGVIAYLPMLVFAFITGATGITALLYVGYLVALGYFLLRDALFGGQSIGKKVMKYAAVREDGSSLNGDFMASLTRNVTLFIPLLDAIFVIIDKPRLGDTLAKTKVVNKV
ncbi:RDD family protein [Flavobacterium sp.]|uniref:RDD family protein n=1 Tax=Flavobacterium sp. TaxID=239 RepID=UPI00286E59E2|nr:RDD family protein [Flavobacterium sp.]